MEEFTDPTKYVVIYLEDWQMRMVKDHLGVDCHRWIVPRDPPTNLKYWGPPGDNPSLKRMYLTEWQKREIRDIAGENCDFVELGPDVIVRYGVPPE